MGLFDSLCGYRTLYGPDGKPLPERGRFKVVGALVTDDELSKMTVITFPPSLLDTATNLPTPGTIVLRDGQGGAAFGGTVAVENLTVSGSLVGLGGPLEIGGNIEFSECRADTFTLRSEVTETRVLDVAPTFTAGEWALDRELRAVNVAPSRPITWALRVPNGAQIVTVAALFSASAGHTGLPSAKAQISLRKMPLSSGIPGEVAAAIDPASTVAAYQSLHLLTLDLTSGGTSPGPTANTSLERYMVRVDAESGGNALSGATVYAVAVTWKRPAGSKIGQD
jgi:hypothetical protein